jgi:hypothetical protein
MRMPSISVLIIFIDLTIGLKNKKFENLPSMVFTPPPVPPFAGDRNLRNERM